MARRHTCLLITLSCALSMPSVVGAEDDDGVVGRPNTATGETSRAAADATEGAASTPRRGRHDYSRFSDGPRRVPRPRGASQRRAEELGLGTKQTATRLLHGRPDPRWVDAAGSAAPESLTWPVETGRFGRGFGYVRRTRPELRHDGVDIVAEEGATVRAAGAGIVAYADNGIRGYGNSVIVVHPNGWVSLYAHLYRATVQPGWRVTAGERIGFVGNTGISRGPHLHFELRVNGRVRNPLDHVDGRPWIPAYRDWRDRRARGEAFTSTAHLTVGVANQAPPRGGEPAAEAPTPRASRAAAPATTAGSADVGTARFARQLLRRGPVAADIEAVEGRRFSNLLWPVRGGAVARRRRGRHPRIDIRADEGSAVRAASDGVVVYVGDDLPGLGLAVVLLHENGWVTLYGGTGETHVEVGQQIQRGEWIARTGRARAGRPTGLRFELSEGGRYRDAHELLVQVP